MIIRSEADLDRQVADAIETARKIRKWYGEYKNRAYYSREAIVAWDTIRADLEWLRSSIAAQREAECQE